MSKLIIVGSSGSGKTTFVRKLRTNVFETRHVATLGVEVHPISHTINGTTHVFNVWDCAGKEEFRGLGDGYYTGANFAIVMLDINDGGSTAEARTYIRDVKRMCGNIPIAIVANKVDVISGHVDAPHREGIFRTSIKDDENIRAPLDWFLRHA